MFEEGDNVDNSAFLVGIRTKQLWAVELFCDWGTETEILNSKGHPPIMYAAQEQCDDICMYLSLRTQNINFEDGAGQNIFVLYLLR